MSTLPTESTEPQRLAVVPKVVPEPQTLSGADVKELLLQGVQAWNELSAKQLADRASERQHQLELERMEYGAR